MGTISVSLTSSELHSPKSMDRIKHQPARSPQDEIMATKSSVPPIQGEAAIVKTPGVCGGSACVRTTRVPVWSLVSWRRQGVPDERLLAMFPALTQRDLDAAWSYADSHRGEIDQDIQENEDA